MADPIDALGSALTRAAAPQRAVLRKRGTKGWREQWAETAISCLEEAERLDAARRLVSGDVEDALFKRHMPLRQAAHDLLIALVRAA